MTVDLHDKLNEIAEELAHIREELHRDNNRAEAEQGKIIGADIYPGAIFAYKISGTYVRHKTAIPDTVAGIKGWRLLGIDSHPFGSSLQFTDSWLLRSTPDLIEWLNSHDYKKTNLQWELVAIP